MIAEILEMILAGVLTIIAIALIITCCYLAYRWIRDYHEDKYMKGEIDCIYGAIAFVFCAIVMTLILLWGWAREMGW